MLCPKQSQACGARCDDLGASAPRGGSSRSRSRMTLVRTNGGRRANRPHEACVEIVARVDELALSNAHDKDATDAHRLRQMPAVGELGDDNFGIARLMNDQPAERRQRDGFALKEGDQCGGGDQRGRDEEACVQSVLVGDPAAEEWAERLAAGGGGGEAGDRCWPVMWLEGISGRGW